MSKFCVDFLFNPVVAFFLKLESEFRSAGVNYASLVEDMHEVGIDLVKQKLIVGDEDGGVVGRFEFVHAAGHDAQGVDVET